MANKFNKGDKVVVLSKSVGASLGNSYWRRKDSEGKTGEQQGYLYVVGYEMTMGKIAVACNIRPDKKSGDYFLEDDLVLYKEKANLSEYKYPFYITGDRKLLEGFQTALSVIGYTDVGASTSQQHLVLVNNLNNIEREEFFQVYLGDRNYNIKRDDNKVFELPNDWAKAWEYCVNQIKLKKELEAEKKKKSEPQVLYLAVGNKGLTVTIYKSGLVDIPNFGKMDSKDVQNLSNFLEKLRSSPLIGGYEIHFPTDRFIRIGCETEGNMFSIEELQTFVRKYDDFVGKK